MPPKKTVKTPQKGSRAVSEQPPQTPAPVPAPTPSRGGRRNVQAPTPGTRQSGRTKGARPQYGGIDDNNNPRTYQSPSDKRTSEAEELETVLEADSEDEVSQVEIETEDDDDFDDDAISTEGGDHDGPLHNSGRHIRSLTSPIRTPPLNDPDEAVASIEGWQRRKSHLYHKPTPGSGKLPTLQPDMSRALFNYVPMLPDIGVSRSGPLASNRPSTGRTPTTSSSPRRPGFAASVRPPPPVDYVLDNLPQIRAVRRKSDPPPDSPPPEVNVRVQANVPGRISWWRCFWEEICRASRYLHPTERRWWIVIPVLCVLYRAMLCSAGPICQKYSRWQIFSKYVFEDTWYSAINFLTYPLIWTLLLAGVCDFATSAFWIPAAFVQVRRKRRPVFRPAYTLRENIRSLRYFMQDFFTENLDRTGESLVIPVLGLTLFRLFFGEKGDGITLCFIFSAIHLAKWAVVATENWDFNRGWGPFRIHPDRRPWKRWLMIPTFVVLACYLLSCYLEPDQARQWLNEQPVTRSNPTPTVVKHAIFSVTRITSVTGDITAAISAMLSSSGLSPVTTA